jgi:threonine dehydratase
MPSDAPASKVIATQGYGAAIVSYDRLTQSREEISARLACEHNMVLVPPYDHPDIMAGQGTTALEFLENVPDLDVLVAPVGGGGLLSGCAIAARAMRPGIKVFGVETETANDWWQSFRRGERVKISPPETIADGIRTQQPGELTFPVVREYVEDILLVSDEQVIEALNFMLLRMKILAEPTGAVAPAAVLNRLIDAPGAKIGVIVSGGNIDPALLARLLGVTSDE